jgi:hypothetical protein
MVSNKWYVHGRQPLIFIEQANKVQSQIVETSNAYPGDAGLACLPMQRIASDLGFA